MKDKEQEPERKPLWYDQDAFKEFKAAYFNKEPQTVLFFVGSGLSQNAGFPTWKGLLEEMARRAKALRLNIGEEFYDLLRENKFPEAGSALRRAFEEERSHHGEWRAILDRVFDDSEKARHIPAVFTTFCKLRWSKVVTTNYDRVLELAYRQLHSEGLTVVHPFAEGYDDSKTFHPSHQKLLFKIHGDIGDPRSQIVLTTEEYTELYAKDLFLDVLKYHLDSAKLILFMGFSHEDPYFKELFKRLHYSKSKPRQSFALFAAPSADEVEAFEEKLRDLYWHTGIKSITYRNTDNRHEEFNPFLKYLSDPDTYDKQYGSSLTRKKATVVLLHAGGTIGSRRDLGEQFMKDELVLPRIKSRFDPELEKISRQLQKRFRQFYNTGTEFQFELKWEILPKEQQILSENATVQHWNNLINKLKDVIFKYVRGPAFVTPELQLPEAGQPEGGEPDNEEGQRRRLNRIFREECAQYAKTHEDKKLKLYPHQFMEDLKDRYIAGIVILHGTDTLASSASALSVGMRNLPFPVILTGANRPPDLEALVERPVFGGKSDTWKNLVTSLYFLQCFGHRFTELFVSFGDTIHHGMNLRKTTVEAAPLKRSDGPTYDIEPFIFRNYSITKQYLFRLIDGVFCNNFYPIGTLSYTQIITPTYWDLRHVRHNPFPAEPADAPDDPAERFTTYEFAPVVKQVTVSPSFPSIDVGCMLSREPGTRAVLVEGYKSGTYPTVEGSPFADFMYDLYMRGIPVILTAHYGISTSQETYQTFPIRGKKIPVLRLYGMIPETALPLLCRVVWCIEPQNWEAAEAAEDGSQVESRIRLITTELKRMFKEDKNIISIEFGDITDQKARRDQIIKNTRSADGDGQALGKEPPAAEDHWEKVQRVPRPGPEQPPDEVSVPRDAVVSIPRVDLLWGFDEFIKSYESVGAAPDGFAILSNMGYEWGFNGFRRLQLEREPRTEDAAFFDCDEAQQDELVKRANGLLRLTINSLEESRLAFFMRKRETVVTVERDGAGSGRPTASPRFSFPVFIRRANESLRDDEKYNVQSYSREEADFFRQLNIEAGREQEREKLAAQYDRLMEESWKNKTGSLDWFILGVFKGVTCAVAWYFLFDRWADEYDKNQTTGVEKALQQSVQCDIELGSAAFFKFRMAYYGWYERD